MDSENKKMDEWEVQDRLSITEGHSRYRVGRRVFNDVEDRKAAIPSQFRQDPFMNEEGTQVQYRSMKWW